MRTKCEACDGTGKVERVSHAHQAYTEERGTYIVDEERTVEDCEVCEGKGSFPSCPDHEDGHHFIESGLNQICSCGEVE